MSVEWIINHFDTLWPISTWLKPVYLSSCGRWCIINYGKFWLLIGGTVVWLRMAPCAHISECLVPILAGGTVWEGLDVARYHRLWGFKSLCYLLPVSSLPWGCIKMWALSSCSSLPVCPLWWSWPLTLWNSEPQSKCFAVYKLPWPQHFIITIKKWWRQAVSPNIAYERP